MASQGQGRGWHGDPEGHAKAGQAQGKENNPGNFANDREKASVAGKRGAEAQPIEAKRKGGENSHKNDNKGSV